MNNLIINANKCIIIRTKFEHRTHQHSDMFRFVQIIFTEFYITETRIKHRLIFNGLKFS